MKPLLRRAGRRGAWCAIWLALCAVVTLVAEWFSHDLLMASVLTLHQAVFEMTAIPAVAAWWLYGIGAMLLVAAWWRPLRGVFLATHLAPAVCRIAYGLGTLWYGAPFGWRPADGTLRLVFIAGVALPGMLRIAGLRFIAVAGFLAILTLGCMAAFRSEIFDIYTGGVRLVACGVSMAPWIAGWIGYETFAAARHALRAILERGEDDDEHPAVGRRQMDI